jgi:fructose-bisphosphate aldolase class II
MPLVTEYTAAKEIYHQVSELGVALPAFCAEDRETLEAILASALEYGQQIGVDDLPIVPACTVRYPPRSQMTLLPACGDPLLGLELMLSDLEVFTGENSPYRNLRVMPHLDHAFPWLDGDVIEGYADRFASVMCDASDKPFEENIRLTAKLVENLHGQVVIEGAADEIYEAGGETEKNEPTTVAQAVRFMRETGVDLIVPNVGTEHRATADKVKYRSDRAREISAAVGRNLCLHGTSSLAQADLSKLTQDGFLKVNIFTTLAVHGGQAVAREVIGNLGSIFDEQQLAQMVDQGVLGKAVLFPTAGDKLPVKPKLSSVANAPRRDAWFAAVKSRCTDFLEAFHYRRFAR